MSEAIAPARPAATGAALLEIRDLQANAMQDVALAVPGLKVRHGEHGIGRRGGARGVEGCGHQTGTPSVTVCASLPR